MKGAVRLVVNFARRGPRRSATRLLDRLHDEVGLVNQVVGTHEHVVFSVRIRK